MPTATAPTTTTRSAATAIIRDRGWRAVGWASTVRPLDASRVSSRVVESMALPHSPEPVARRQQVAARRQPGLERRGTRVDRVRATLEAALWCRVRHVRDAVGPHAFDEPMRLVELLGGRLLAAERTGWSERLASLIG